VTRAETRRSRMPERCRGAGADVGALGESANGFARRREQQVAQRPQTVASESRR
jgi:hypothetical protein